MKKNIFFITCVICVLTSPLLGKRKRPAPFHPKERKAITKSIFFDNNSIKTDSEQTEDCSIYKNQTFISNLTTRSFRQEETSILETLLTYAYLDLSELERKWDTFNDELATKIKKAEGNVVKQRKINREIGSKMEAIEAEIERIEYVIGYLQKERSRLHGERLVEEEALEIEEVIAEEPVVVPQDPPKISKKKRIDPIAAKRRRKQEPKEEVKEEEPVTQDEDPPSPRLQGTGTATVDEDTVYTPDVKPQPEVIEEVVVEEVEPEEETPEEDDEFEPEKTTVDEDITPVDENKTGGHMDIASDDVYTVATETIEEPRQIMPKYRHRSTRVIIPQERPRTTQIKRNPRSIKSGVLEKDLKPRVEKQKEAIDERKRSQRAKARPRKQSAESRQEKPRRRR